MSFPVNSSLSVPTEYSNCSIGKDVLQYVIGILVGICIDLLFIVNDIFIDRIVEVSKAPVFSSFWRIPQNLYDSSPIDIRV